MAPTPVVTGDAVVLDVQIAQLPVRAVGALIDLFVVGICYVLAAMLWSASVSHFDDALASALMITFAVAAIVGCPLAMESLTRGRSLGKIAMGLRVVSDDGGPERFRQALFRVLAGVVEIWMLFGAPAVIASLCSPKGKRLGDMFAGTVVISERGPKPLATPMMPPSLQWWAATLELSGLGPQQADMARQFLARAAELTPTIRNEMGYRVAADIVSRISPPPPPGTPPQLVLEAVLAERHRRALIQLQSGLPVTARAAVPPLAGPPAPAPRPVDGGFVPPS